jgi:hypothetical protein
MLMLKTLEHELNRKPVLPVAKMQEATKGDVQSFVTSALAELRNKEISQQQENREPSEETKTVEVKPKLADNAIIPPEPVTWERQGPKEGEKRQRVVSKEQKFNVHFERYYQKLGLVPESEWAEFYDTLQTPLDVAFRVNSISTNKLKTITALKMFVEVLKSEGLQYPQPVKWYPVPDVCYCFEELGRAELRKSEPLK